MLESPTPISFVHSAEPRPSAIPADMIPHLIRVYPHFIGVHQRPWTFVEIFRLAKPKREDGRRAGRNATISIPWQGVYFPRGSKKSMRLPSFTDGRRSMP